MSSFIHEGMFTTSAVGAKEAPEPLVDEGEREEHASNRHDRETRCNQQGNENHEPDYEWEREAFAYDSKAATCGGKLRLERASGKRAPAIVEDNAFFGC
jgi:hypothetical protein